MVISFTLLFNVRDLFDINCAYKFGKTFSTKSKLKFIALCTVICCNSKADDNKHFSFHHVFLFHRNSRTSINLVKRNICIINTVCSLAYIFVIQCVLGMYCSIVAVNKIFKRFEVKISNNETWGSTELNSNKIA